MTWQLPDTYHSAGSGRGTATFKFYEGRDILSGYTAASPNTYVRVTAYWYSGSTAAGATSEWAWTSRSPNYPYVCNSGQPYAIS